MILVPRPVTEWASSRLISTSRRSWGTVTVIVIDDFRLTGTFTLIPPRSSSVDGFTQLFVLCFAVIIKSFISSFHFWCSEASTQFSWTWKTRFCISVMKTQIQTRKNCHNDQKKKLWGREMCLIVSVLLIRSLRYFSQAGLRPCFPAGAPPGRVQ